MSSNVWRGTACLRAARSSRSGGGRGNAFYQPRAYLERRRRRCRAAPLGRLPEGWEVIRVDARGHGARAASRSRRSSLVRARCRSARARDGARTRSLRRGRRLDGRRRRAARGGGGARTHRRARPDDSSDGVDDARRASEPLPRERRSRRARGPGGARGRRGDGAADPDFSRPSIRPRRSRSLRRAGRACCHDPSAARRPRTSLIPRRSRACASRRCRSRGKATTVTRSAAPVPAERIPGATPDRAGARI